MHTYEQHGLGNGDSEFYAHEAHRFSWGAIFAGTVSAIGVWLLLYTLGLAVGLTSVDEGDVGSLRSMGIFTGVWSVITPLIALFIGGFVASRGAGLLTRGAGAMHGLVVWGLTTLVGLLLISSVLGALFSAGARATGAAVSAGGQGGGQVTQALGIDTQDALQPINERLRAEGKPPISAEQLQAATRDVVQSGIREGGVDREALIESIARNTALSRADAEEVATRLQGQIDQAQARAGEGVTRAAETTGKAFWAVFGALLLGLLSALGGGVLGVSREQLEGRRIAAPREEHRDEFEREHISGGPGEAHT